MCCNRFFLTIWRADCLAQPAPVFSSSWFWGETAMLMLVNWFSCFHLVTQLGSLSSVDTSRWSKCGINKSLSRQQKSSSSVDCAELWVQEHHQFPDALSLSGRSCCLSASTSILHLSSSMWFSSLSQYHSSNKYGQPTTWNDSCHHNSRQDNPPLHLAFWVSSQDYMTAVKVGLTQTSLGQPASCPGYRALSS